MAMSGVKFDEDGTLGGFATNCFPVKSFLRKGTENGGAWLVAQRAEQRRRFKAVLCTKPRTYSRIREERKKTFKTGAVLSQKSFVDQEEEAPTLDGFFLLKHCCVEDPSDICTININGLQMCEATTDDFAMFDSVAYVNAGENYLPFEAFRGFPNIRELELPLNGLRKLQINEKDFPYLEMLDLSYNNLSQEDILLIGTLITLRVLHLTGNNFHTLPEDMAQPFKHSKGSVLRFTNLEVLTLDDNGLSDPDAYASLATLPRLRHLNLEKNEFTMIPQLKTQNGRIVMQTDKVFRSGRRSRLGKRKTPRKVRKTIQVETESALTTTPVPFESVITNVVDTSRVADTAPEVEAVNAEVTEDLQATFGDLSARINELNLDQYEDVSAPPDILLDSERPTLPPFPELRYISLAHNKVSEEEALLPVAAWPVLVELVIHDNPLTTQNSGDPPLLKRFLQKRLGINLIRKPPELPKKPVEMPNKKSRKVSSIVRKIPKITVDERLMLEAPRPPPPRVSSAPEATRRSPVRSPSPQPAKSAPEEEQGDSFFMTQGSNPPVVLPDDQTAVPPGRSIVVKVPHNTEQTALEQYRGYEELLELDDVSEDEELIPKDMQGCIRTLKYALNHQLVYRDSAVQLDTVRKVVEPYKKHALPYHPPVPRSERIGEVLDNLRTRSTVDEANLKQVMDDRERYQRQFPESQQLLNQIQHRYNAVRTSSMREAREVKVVHGTLQKDPSQRAMKSVPSQRNMGGPLPPMQKSH